MKVSAWLKSPKFALQGLFLVMGIVSMAWVPRIPEIKNNLALSDGELGLVLISSSIGAVFGAQSAGHLVQRFGSKRLISILQFVMPFGLFVMGIADNTAFLVIGLFIMGLGYAGIDIAANSQAVVAEKVLKQKFLASLHGYWSIGAFTAALIGGVSSSYLSSQSNLVSISIFGALAFSFLSSGLLGAEHDERTTSETGEIQRLPWFSKGLNALWAMAIGSTGSFIAEGAASDWSGVLLVEHLQTSNSISASAFASFSFAMIISRFTADQIMHRFGLFLTIRIAGIFGGLIWGSSILIAVWVNDSTPLLALIIVNLGFFAAGLAVGPMFPAFILGASRIPGVAPSLGIARIGVIAIAGYFVGPTITGFISEATSLPVALMYPTLVLVLSGIMAQLLKVKP